MPLLPRVVLQPQQGVLGPGQRPGGQGKRGAGPDVAAGEGGEDGGQTLKLPSAPTHGSINEIPNMYSAQPCSERFAGLSV